MVDIYVDSVAGDDTNNGLTSGAPVKTLTQVRTLMVATTATTDIFIKGGQTITGSLILDGFGSIQPYGDGRPTWDSLNATALDSTLLDGWSIYNIDFVVSTYAAGGATVPRGVKCLQNNVGYLEIFGCTFDKFAVGIEMPGTLPKSGLDIEGCTIKNCQQGPVGTGSGYLVNNGAGYAVGSTTVAADTGSGTILVGDFIKFATSPQSYRVTAALSAGSFSFTPGLIAAVADNVAITIVGTNTGHGIFVQGCVGVGIGSGAGIFTYGNNIYNCDGNGIYISAGTGVAGSQCTSVQVKKNVIANCGSHGARMGSGGIFQDNLIANCDVSIEIGGGDVHTPSLLNTTVRGNAFLEGRDVGSSPNCYAMRIANVQNCAVDANIIAHEGGASPILLSVETSNGAVNSTVFSNNVVYDWGAPVVVLGSSPGITIQANNPGWTTPDQAYPYPTRRFTDIPDVTSWYRALLFIRAGFGR